MDRREVLGVLSRRHGARSHAPVAPTSLKVQRADASTVVLSWKPGRGGVKAARYAVLRAGKRIGTTKATTFTDRTAQPDQPYRYQVQALSRSGRASRSSRALSGPVPSAPPPPRPAPGTSGGGGSAPAGVDPIRS